jgi:2-succinyl-5-enolpyruvyl-6-hydroxy-3-cyclohexene-1-carboxylate synthase
VFVDELARGGLRAVCIAPGSRSTPLTVAFAADERVCVYSHIDERSAGFFALGMALASGEPVALVCTSGTAPANFHPAVIEAYHARVPLLVLTADRPHELRASGANQAIDQVKLYGDHVRWFVDVAPPEAQPPARVLRSLCTLAARALAVAGGPPAGPVHLNFPFRKPLEPIPVPGDVPESPPHDAHPVWEGRADGAPVTRIARGILTPTSAQINALVEAIQNAPRGLIVCGPRCPAGDFPQTVARMAHATGYPILADALSGVRFGPHVAEGAALILGGYETFLQSAVPPWAPPQLILRFGAMPTSKVLETYLESLPACRQVALNGDGVWEDATHSVAELLWADPATTCRRVAERLAEVSTRPADAHWVDTLRRAEQVAWDAVDAACGEAFFEGAILPAVIGTLPPHAVLYVGNSLPVRHLDQFARPQEKPLRIFANRGASGIDGTVSSALGAAAATNAPLVLVTGDLAFYHDLNGLLALRRCGVRATIVLIHNDGGGIFHRLPIAAFDPPFTDLFVTPHGLDFEPVVRMYGAAFIRVRTPDALRDALQTAIGAPTPHVIEVRSDAGEHERRRREIVEAVVGSVKRQPRVAYSLPRSSRHAVRNTQYS